MSFLTTFLFWTVIIFVLIKLYIKLTTGWCTSNVCLQGKTVIVTGANTGIGYHTAADFAKRGAKVILACRDEAKGTQAIEKIKKESDNNNIVFEQLDLASFKSVREFAERIKKSEPKLDILVNNAGAGNHGQKKGENGMLLLMQVNYFGPFLLTNLLLDLLKKTPNSRIVNVASLIARFVSSIDVNNLNDFPHNSRKAESDIYGRSKACNILFTTELAEKLRDTTTTTYSVHPGVVLTEIFRTMPPLMKYITEMILKTFFKDALEGAQTSIYCSVAKGIESLSGEHFEDCHVVSRYKIAQDFELARNLWKVSEKLVNIN